MRFIVTFILVALIPVSLMAEAGEFRIAAAANLHHALPEIVEAFQRKAGHTSKLIFGASGNLARQIVQGAPFEVFLSADEDYVDFLVDRGVTDGEGVVYAHGRLALFIPVGSGVRSTPNLNGLLASQRDGRLKRIAIANPLHAPYGVAARTALERAHVWDVLVPHLVMGENVAQATQFALTGAVDVALTSLSNVLLPEMQDRGSYVVVDNSLYPPLRQRMVLTKGSGNAAVEFYEFMQRTETGMILSRHGFALPGDSGASNQSD